MKKIIFTLTLMAAFSLALSACSYGGVNFSINSENVQGSGAMKSETRDLSSFSRVELRSIAAQLQGIAPLDQAWRLALHDVARVGEDVRLIGRPSGASAP